CPPHRSSVCNSRARHSCACRRCQLRMARPLHIVKNFADGSAICSYHLEMHRTVAIIGAGVSGLTCGIVFAERGYRTAIFAKETGQQTTSGAAAAVWFPYDAQPAERVIPWALTTYEALVELSRDIHAGISMIELRQFSRTREIQ